MQVPRIYTSYFYNVRFMAPHVIPLSTAVWDPKWFHAFKTQKHTFIDKNGVINGLRADPFVPNHTCDGLCRGPETCKTKDPNTCPFLQAYSLQLSALPFNDVLGRMWRLADKCRDKTQAAGDPVFVYLVHEAPNNPCSERIVIQNYFKTNDVDCHEFNPKSDDWK